MLSPAFVYILTNKRHTVLYVGVTNDLKTRLWEHSRTRNSFAFRYNLIKLVYVENFESIKRAIAREKYLKGKTRKFKIDLINKKNPFWLDLSLAL
jgi:putative endonuclease